MAYSILEYACATLSHNVGQTYIYPIYDKITFVSNTKKKVIQSTLRN